MKIVFIARERTNVRVATSALHAAGLDVDLAWVSRFEDAAHWIFSNPDFSALILEAQLGADNCASFLANLRRRSIGAPALVVAAEPALVSASALGLGPHDSVIAQRTMHRDLPLAVQRLAADGPPPAIRDGFAHKLAEAQAAVERAERARAADAASAADQLAQRTQAFTVSLSEVIRSRDALEQRLAELVPAYERARRDRDADVSAASERHALLSSQLERESTVRMAAEAKTAALEDALKHAEALRTRDAAAAASAVREVHDLRARLERAQADVTSAVMALERRETAHAGALDDAAGARAALERRLAKAEAALAKAESALEDADARAKRDEQAAAARLAALDTRIADLEMRLTHESERATTFEDALARAEQARRDADEVTMRDRLEAAEHAAQLQAELEARLLESRDERQALEGRLANFEVARRDAEAAHASAVAGMATQFADHHARLEGEMTAARAAAEAAERAWRDEMAALKARAEAEVADLSRHWESDRLAASRELESLRSDRDRLREQAELVPGLQLDRDDLRSRIQRQFDDHPLPMCRCTREGVLTGANRAFAVMVGAPSSDAARLLELPARQFDGSRDLGWLVERCQVAGGAPSVEATWKRADGSRLVVRLFAFAVGDEIRIVAQDMTPQRVLEERLGRAQRMEAVGRLASEVAVTCGTLLDDVNDDGASWLSTLDGLPAARQQGERLLAEVARAAGFLRQFADYGGERVDPLEPVELYAVLHDLEPVLQEVAGDDIELVLPPRPANGAAPLNVDLRLDRVERLLVNLANYGRERMPDGGSMSFDLTPTVVDGPFIEKHPNVRPGPHVLLTVTEAKGPERALGPFGAQHELAMAHDEPLPQERPGVDLGGLQRLVRECGGHLWMEASPTGDIIFRIHLPLLPA